MNVILGPEHPANNPITSNVYHSLISTDTEYSCFICNAILMFDPDYTTKRGVILHIPWHLCIEHIPKKGKLADYIKKVDKCVNRRARRKIGIAPKELARYRKFIYKRKSSKIGILKNLQSNPYKESEHIFQQADKQAKINLNAEIKDKNQVGTRDAYDEYVGERYREIYGDILKNQNLDVTKKRAIDYLRMGLLMIDLAELWSKNKYAQQSPVRQKMNAGDLVDVALPNLKNPGTACDSSASGASCEWVGGIQYPCIDNKCLTLIRQSEGVSLLYDGSRYIIYSPEIDPTLSENLVRLGLCGERVDRNRFTIEYGDIRPLRDYFMMEPVMLDCDLDGKYKNRLLFITNCLFWYTVSSLISALENLRIELTLDNVWVRWEGSMPRWYIWNTRKTTDGPFMDRFPDADSSMYVPLGDLPL